MNRAYRERIGRVLNGPGALPRIAEAPLDVAMLVAGFAIYGRVPHANEWTIVLLFIGAECLRRALCEIVAVTRYKNFLKQRPQAKRPGAAM
jgi:hypothetical protein